MGKYRAPADYDFRHQLFDEQYMLATTGSKRRSSVRTAEVEHIDIHHMTILSTNNGGALAACYWTWQTREASAHYGVDKKRVAQFVYDNRMAWGNGNAYANQRGIIVEHANKTAGPKWEIDRETLETSAELVAGLHITHELGMPRSKGFGESGTIRTHQSFFATACPGPFFRTVWDEYVAMVQKEYIKMTKKPAPKPTPTPKPEPAKPEVTLDILHWNIAGSDTAHGYKKSNSYRGPSVGRHALDIGFDVFMACEAGQSDLWRGVNQVLGKFNPWQKSAKGSWYDDKKVSLIRGRKSYGTSKYSYLKTKKYGIALFGEKGGKKFSVLEIHTDYRKPAKQAAQVRELFNQWKKDCDDLKIARKNRFIVGDFNWDGTSGDDPFKALTDVGFIEHGNKSKATFLNGQHLDGFLGWRTIDATVKVMPRFDDKMNLSDHMPVWARVPLI